ncbi:sel1 repeat family protein [Sphingobium sp. SCG-1]|uniref:tetratricopeptide repeat protein n=1 Tax=Sphingobium sp. SCG-1 TaxID=2072936 RepID=UPI000CD69732|nr:tetratricopeptide repeat protein [Sphingobium sp. SCG-1]AUW57268.1 sel1 repeat family protein [Sphingobium sp. SCG-1]
MATPDLDSLKAMSAQELAARLTHDPQERLQIIRIAAEGGLAEAQLIYGQMLLDGIELPADPVAAVSWFNRAAQQHDMMALNMVGRCYDLGWGVGIDKARAAECYRVAAAEGLPHAMYNYATLLTLGEGVVEDKAGALEWFRRAAAGADTGIAAKASNYIGSFYEDGWVVERDMAKAAQYYLEAAEGGDFRGQFNLARLLGDAGDLDEALFWLAKIRETATVAFVEKAHAWLLKSDIPGFAGRGVAALVQGQVGA